MNFEEAVEYVRKHFFPRWDKKREWTIREGHSSEINGAFGLCDDKTKTISVPLFTIRGMVLLIHEIAHAATNSSHGKRWQERMKKAALKARELGHGDLAKGLLDEVEGYKRSIDLLTPKVIATEAYDQISNYVYEHPGCTFQEVVDFVRGNWAMSSEEFIRSFRRAEKVFLDSKQPIKM